MTRRIARWTMVVMLVLGLASCSSSSGGNDARDPEGEVPGDESVLADLGTDGAASEDDGTSETGDPGGEVVPPVPCNGSDDCAVLLEGGSRPCQEPFCASDGFCRWAPLPNGLPCDDRDPCTVSDQCRMGECVGRPRDCDDDNPCTLDRCDAQGTCSHDPIEGLCDDGNPCTAEDRCVAGRCEGGRNQCSCVVDRDCPDDGDRCNGVLQCANGVCVLDPSTVVRCEEDDSPCTESRCRPETGTCETVPVREGAPCDDGNACTAGDRCRQGVCMGTTTVPCDDGNPCTEDLCDAQRGCVHRFHQDPCDDGNPCTVEDACRQGVCVGRLTPRCGCSVDSDCAALEDGDLCNGRLTCQEGICRVDPSTVVTCDPVGLGPCRTAVCDPRTGACLPKNLADGRPCDDGDACTISSQCLAGVCVGVGERLFCEDGQECTEDRCDPTLGCVHEPRSGPCDDGNLCTENDFCQAGRCVPGTWKTCLDGNPCTDDRCEPLLGCVFPENSEPCDDGDPCTTGDRCIQGRCRPGPRDPCDDDNPCTTDYCDSSLGSCIHEPNSEPCEDGDWCTVDDVCSQRVCRAGRPRDCSDGNPCTRDRCDSEARECIHEADDAAVCDDGKACTQDFCRGGECVSLVACDDGNPCTRDFCDLETGECTAEPIEAPCDDGDPCTVEDACQGDGTCQGVAMDCEEGNLCTIDSCDPDTGRCLHEDVPIDDGDLCTVDSCDPETGRIVHVPIECSNGDVCDGLETCDPRTGLCIQGTPVQCDDGDLCNGLESCDPNTGDCVPGTPLDCEDHLECTQDECLPTAGCVHWPLLGSPCNDWDRCTVNDRCQPDGRCAGQPVQCSDGDHCNGIETCDPTSGACVAGVPVVCDDGDVCNGQETCDRTTGLCVQGTPLSCDDGEPCTDDLCDPRTGCYWENNTAPCEDGLVCTVGDRCRDGLCLPGGPRDCDDRIACTVDACIESQGCVHWPDDGACEDGNDCTEDFCDVSAGGCSFRPRHGIPCDDRNACTENDTCHFGACLGTGRICDDGITCTQDACDPEVGCVNSPVHARCDDRNHCTDNLCVPEQGGCVFPDNEAPCDDGNPCTRNDRCALGQCTGGDPDPCDDGVACTQDVCQDFVGCMNTPVDNLCDDGNVCTVDVCDAVRDCLHEPLTGDPCDDLDPCTTSDRCEAGRCVGFDPDPCDDQVECTEDSCVVGSGCRHEAKNERCDDGASCTVDLCTASGCQWWPIHSLCADDNPCTEDRCLGPSGDPGTGCVRFSLDGIDCSDDDLCTEGDHCVAGRCIGSPISCDDGLPCSKDSCDPDVGCVNVLDDALCDDGIPCTRDVCTSEGCRSEPDDALCNDGIACTEDLCIPSLGGCVFLPRDSHCDDATDCTSDHCDPQAGCVWTPRNDLCDDGIPCTTDRCVPGTGCTNAPDHDACADAYTCTLDYCDLDARDCVHLPQHWNCEDGLVCTQDTCEPGLGDPVTGCRTVVNLGICDDGNPCTRDLCGPAGSPPLGCYWENQDQIPCDDEDVCTLGDVCFGGRCLSGEVDCRRPECGNHPCDDGDVCTATSRCVNLGSGQGYCEQEMSLCDRPDCAGYLCDDGDPCTLTDLCQADGSCLGQGRACMLPACAAHPDCPETDCFDGVDENLDGRTDCWDPSCRHQTGCLVSVGWCRLQWPVQITTVEGAPTTVYGRVYVEGITTRSGGTDPYPALVAQVGYGPSGTEPWEGGWTWFPASPNAAYGPGSPSYEPLNDEYQGELPGSPPPGADFAFRFSGDNGSVWLHCDRDARSQGRGDGSADGYDPQDAGKMVSHPNLFFSEYVEGSSNNKAVEVYNAGSQPIPLSSIVVRIYFNGATTPGSTIPLGTSGSLTPGTVFVLCNSSSVDALLSRCDGTSGNLTFNGDDAVELLGPGSVALDVIGQIGHRPVPEWGTGLVSTMDNTIRRKCSVIRGDPDGTNGFDPAQEWDGFAVDTFDGLGARGCP